MATTQSSILELVPRLHELKSAVPTPWHSDAYFKNFEERLKQSEHVRFQYMKYERPLSVLDTEAWRDLKRRATPLTMRRDPARGWQALFDTLNEGLGYAYLHSIGCTDITFIQRDSAKTPDLRATHDGRCVLCEVKTINVSQDEADRRERVCQGEIKVTEVRTRVTTGMLDKVTTSVAHAIDQLVHADAERAARRIVFIVLHFDDWVGDYQTEYLAQLDAHLLAGPSLEAELVLSPASNAFARRFTMQAATVVEL